MSVFMLSILTLHIAAGHPSVRRYGCLGKIKSDGGENENQNAHKLAACNLTTLTTRVVRPRT